MERILVIGISGSGKTTFARRLAQRLGCACTELDELFWAAGWQPKPREQFRELAARASDGERWVVDGNYGSARDVLWPRATAVVWLNYSFGRVFLQLLGRTLRRVRTHLRLTRIDPVVGDHHAWAAPARVRGVAPRGRVPSSAVVRAAPPGRGARLHRTRGRRIKWRDARHQPATQRPRHGGAAP